MLASNPLGAAFSPLAVVAVMSLWGWRPVFYCLSAIGIVMALTFWIFVADSPASSKRVSALELREIEGNGEPALVARAPSHGLFAVLRQPYVLKYCLVAFFSGTASWGFMTWLPTYLIKARGFSMLQMGVAASLPFFAGALGAIFGGWLSDNYFSSRRRVPIIASQIASALLLYLTIAVKSVAVLIICQTLTGMFLMFLTASFWALPMNTVPRSLMGTCGGLINMAAQIAALLIPMLFGYLVGATGGRFDLGFASLIAALLISCAIVFTLPTAPLSSNLHSAAA